MFCNISNFHFLLTFSVNYSTKDNSGTEQEILDLNTHDFPALETGGPLEVP